MINTTLCYASHGTTNCKECTKKCHLARVNDQQSQMRNPPKQRPDLSPTHANPELPVPTPQFRAYSAGHGQLESSTSTCGHVGQHVHVVARFACHPALAANSQCPTHIRSGVLAGMLWSHNGVSAHPGIRTMIWRWCNHRLKCVKKECGVNDHRAGADDQQRKLQNPPQQHYNAFTNTRAL